MIIFAMPPHLESAYMTAAMQACNALGVPPFNSAPGTGTEYWRVVAMRMYEQRVCDEISRMYNLPIY